MTELVVFTSKVMDNMCIVIICLPVYDAINFEIDFSFLSSSFPTWAKRSGQKFKYLKYEKSF